jgi:hypothetical protein
VQQGAGDEQGQEAAGAHLSTYREAQSSVKLAWESGIWGRRGCCIVESRR